MKEFMKSFTRVTDKICGYVNWFSMATVACMMLLITADVVAKQIFGSPIDGCYEVCQLILSTLVFSSWAYVQTVHAHIHVTMFVSKFPQKLRFLSFGITAVVSAATMAIATVAVYYQIIDKFHSRECTGVLMLPYWPFYIFELLAFGLLSVVLLRDAVKAIWAMFDQEFAEEVQSTWV